MNGRRVRTVLAAALAGLLAACGTTGSGQAATSGQSGATPTEGGATTEAPARSSGAAPGEEARTNAGADTAARSQESRPGVAVFPFTNGGSYGEDALDLANLRVGLQQMLLTELDQSDELRIVERSMLDQIMEEQDLGRTDRVDPQTAARIGKIVGARYIVTGVFADVQGNLRMDARIIDTETTEILETASVEGDREDLYPLLVDLAGKVVQKVDLPPLPARVMEERRKRNVPPEAMELYHNALTLEDAGATDQAVEMYRRIVDQFPDVTQAREQLEQLTGEGG